MTVFICFVVAILLNACKNGVRAWMLELSLAEWCEATCAETTAIFVFGCVLVAARLFGY
jgi:uncharacterized membrane protein YecN with MAPEG domain